MTHPALGPTKIERDYAVRRRRGLQIMKNLGVKSEDELIALLSDRKQPLSKRRQICKALGYLATANGDKALAEVYERDQNLRRAAWRGLESIQWKKSYFDTHQVLKGEAIRLMAELGVNSVRELTQIVLNRHANVRARCNACVALGGLGLVKPLPTLLRVFQERDEKLIWSAAHAVIGIGSRSATSRLLAIIKKSNNKAARRAAIYALGFIRDVRAKPVLIRIVNAESEDEYTRSLAIEALSATSNARDATDALIHATRDQSVYVRFTAVNSIDVENPKARKALRDRLTDEGTLPDRGSIGKLAHNLLQDYRKYSASRRKA